MGAIESDTLWEVGLTDFTQFYFLDFQFKDAPICKNKTLRNLASIFQILMAQSYRFHPRPCSTMKMIVEPDMQEIQYCRKERKEKQFCSQHMKLRIRFPNYYTEIKQERVILDIIIYEIV